MCIKAICEKYYLKSLNKYTVVCVRTHSCTVFLHSFTICQQHAFSVSFLLFFCQLSHTDIMIQANMVSRSFSCCGYPHFVLCVFTLYITTTKNCDGISHDFALSLNMFVLGQITFLYPTFGFHVK